jgi:flavin-binding protein dodecin
MGQVPHGSATTTAAIRRAIQHSQESLRALASRYGVNQKGHVPGRGVGAVGKSPAEATAKSLA